MKTLVNILGVAAIAVTFTSCLKDKPINELEYGMANYDRQAIVELPSPPTHRMTVAMDYEDAVKVVDMVTVGIAADQPLSEELQVVLDTTGTAAAIADYNNANGTAIVKLPNNFYTYQGSGLNVTMPGGSRLVPVKGSINAINFDPSTTYALQYTIKSVDKSGYTISGNFGKVFVLFGAKNKYDGVYLLRFKMLDWLAAYGIDNVLVEWGGPVHLETVSGNSVKLFDDWGFGTYIHPAATPTAYTGFGSTEPRFIFDNNTNEMIGCVNDFVNPSNGRQFLMNPAVSGSKFDPATKDIYAGIILRQPGRPDLQIFDTLTYVGPR